MQVQGKRVTITVADDDAEWTPGRDHAVTVKGRQIIIALGSRSLEDLNGFLAVNFGFMVERDAE